MLKVKVSSSGSTSGVKPTALPISSVWTVICEKAGTPRPAIFHQRLAVALAGFLVGGWFMAGLLGVQLASARGGDLLLMFIAGVIAAVLAVWLFDLALVVLSSIAGADLILVAFHPRPGLGRLLHVVLVALGIAVQLGWTAPRRERA